MTPPTVLLTADIALAWVACKRLPLVSAYLLAVPVPYLALGARYPRSETMWLVAGAHALVAAYVTFRAMPEGKERWWLMLTCAVVATLAVGLFLFAGTGRLVVMIPEYLVLTGGCVIASTFGLFGAAYVWAFYGWRSSVAPWLVGIYFLADVIVNAMYRWRPFARDFVSALTTADHLCHLGVVAIALLMQASAGKPQLHQQSH